MNIILISINKNVFKNVAELARMCKDNAVKVCNPSKKLRVVLTCEPEKSTFSTYRTGN
jgi:hypothetical protein